MLKGIEPDSGEHNTNTQVVHEDIARFTIDTVSYHVEKSRFVINTTTGPWIRLADKARSIFGDHLIHTPVKAFGINRTYHFNLQNLEKRTRLGRTLAPIDPWGDFGRQLDTNDPEMTGGMTVLIMTRITQLDKARVETNVKIEPSKHIASKSGGVYLEVNSHHLIQGLTDGQGCETAIDLIVNRFDEIINEADEIYDRIAQLGSEMSDSK